jgi:2'-5' RNA ligase superfamily
VKGEMKPTLGRFRRIAAMAVMTVVGFAFALSGRNAPAQKSAGKEVTAIEILLEPDEVMVRHAAAANAHLLSVYPSGYKLDALHAPHITMVQRFVRTADLDKAYAAAGKVFARENVNGMKLRATGYYYDHDKSIGLAGIVIEPTPELIKLQQDLLDAVAPYAEKTGTVAAFATNRENPDVNPAGIAAIVKFVPKASGKNFNPHVSVGIAEAGYLNGMFTQPFDPFTFSTVGASVYQVGNNGTAMTKLHSFQLKD